MVEHPITLKEYVIPSMKTTRQDYINDKNRKYGGSSKFSFRKYKTDKERLDEYLREKEENQKQIDRVKSQNSKVSPDKPEHASKFYHSIEQPIMRYKPRTDLERIYYSINDYSYGKISKDIIDEQLSKLDLNKLKKKEEEDPMETTLLDKYKNLDEKLIEDLQTQKEFLNRQGYTEKNSETVKQIEMILNAHQQESSKAAIDKEKEDDKGSKRKNKVAIKNQINSNAAKKMMSEYHTKTFFKGASVYSLNIDDLYFNKNKDNDPNRASKTVAFGNGNNTSVGFFVNKINDGNNKNIKNIDNSNNNLISNYNKTNSNLNIAGKHSISNINFNKLSGKHKENITNRNNNYLVFSEKDEPYMDELIEEENRINTLENTNYNNYKTNLPHKNNKNFNWNKKGFSHTNYGNHITRDFTDIANNDVFSSIDFNPMLKKKEEKCDLKSLLYLKNISASSTLVNENTNSEENSMIGGRKKTGFLSNLKNKSVQMNLKGNYSFINEFNCLDLENLNLRQTVQNDPDEMRKYDEEKITIDNHTYLKSQIDLISKSVLRKCNYLHNKSDFNNKSLKSGQGKLMMTSGLSINDFVKKFNMPK